MLGPNISRRPSLQSHVLHPRPPDILWKGATDHAVVSIALTTNAVEGPLPLAHRRLHQESCSLGLPRTVVPLLPPAGPSRTAVPTWSSTKSTPAAPASGSSGRYTGHIPPKSLPA